LSHHTKYRIEEEPV